MSETPKHYLGRVPKDADLGPALNQICKEQGITRGSVTLIGALTKAALGFYDQETFSYETHEVNEPVEILAGLGNVSLKDGEPFVHLHLTLGRGDCTTLGGHTMPGCIVFACEVCIQELPGEDLVRGFDEPTKLPLWERW